MALEAVGKIAVTLQTTMDVASAFALDDGYDAGVKTVVMVTKWWHKVAGVKVASCTEGERESTTEDALFLERERRRRTRENSRKSRKKI